MRPFCARHPRVRSSIRVAFVLALAGALAGCGEDTVGPSGRDYAGGSCVPVMGGGIACDRGANAPPVATGPARVVPLSLCASEAGRSVPAQPQVTSTHPLREMCPWMVTYDDVLRDLPPR